MSHSNKWSGFCRFFSFLVVLTNEPILKLAYKAELDHHGIVSGRTSNTVIQKTKNKEMRKDTLEK